MLFSFLPVWFEILHNPAPFTNPDFLPNLNDARNKFYLYGKQDEIDSFEAFIKAIRENDTTKASETLSVLIDLVRSRIRYEVRIN